MMMCCLLIGEVDEEDDGLQAGSHWTDVMLGATARPRLCIVLYSNVSYLPTYLPTGLQYTPREEGAQGSFLLPEGPLEV